MRTSYAVQIKNISRVRREDHITSTRKVAKRLINPEGGSAISSLMEEARSCRGMRCNLVQRVPLNNIDILVAFQLYSFPNRKYTSIETS